MQTLDAAVYTIEVKLDRRSPKNSVKDEVLQVCSSYQTSFISYIKHARNVPRWNQSTVLYIGTILWALYILYLTYVLVLFKFAVYHKFIISCFKKIPRLMLVFMLLAGFHLLRDLSHDWRAYRARICGLCVWSPCFCSSIKLSFSIFLFDPFFVGLRRRYIAV